MTADPPACLAERFGKALLIVDPGACNPSGIAHTIFEACREVRDEGGDVRTDPAIRLMVTQLAYLCQADSDTDEYGELVRLCRSKAEGGSQP